MKRNTSWGEVADWYDDLLQDNDSYQSQVILPNLLRAMNIKKGETVADIACGNGFFSGQFQAAGARVIGTDISPELIATAKKNNPGIDFFVSPADDPDKLVAGFAKIARDKLADKAVCVLAIQNIENVKGLFESCRRILVPGGPVAETGGSSTDAAYTGGSLYIVMNHPAYRIPQNSSWGFDQVSGRQYRRIDQYLSEMKTSILMNPGARKDQKTGQKKTTTTISFHRPLQYYFKLLQAAGFSVTRLEEWISHRRSQPGPRQKEEDRTRTEFPLFLFLEARRM